MYQISYSTQEESKELIELFNKYPVSSSLSYTMDRSPDYFSFCNLHNDFKVLIARSQQLIGAITLTFSQAFLEGRIKNIAYISDLRVETSARGTGLGDQLMREGLFTCHKTAGDKNVPVFACVIKDNVRGLKKFANLKRDNLASFVKIADIITYFIFPFALKRISRKVKNYIVRPALKEDLPEMLSLWNEVNSKKNLAPVLNYENFEKFINKAPDLSISSYLLAIDKNNNIKAFFGIWNQSAIRRIIITSESGFIKLIRKVWGILRPLTGLASFPIPGQSLDFYNVINLCIPETEAETLTLLLSAAFKRVKDNNSLFLAMALDKKDPLNKKLNGLIASTSELVLLSNNDLNNISTHNKSPNRLYHLEISMG